MLENVRIGTMALTIKHKDIEFGVGDKVRVIQRIKEGAKERSTTFEGIVISIRGKSGNHSFIVRRIGEARIGIEKIFPLEAPTLEKIEVLKSGTRGVKRAKLLFIRKKSAREIEKIYSRASLRKSK